MAEQLVALLSAEWDVVDLVDSLDGVTLAGFFAPDARGAAADFPHLGTDDDWPAVRERMPELKIAFAFDAPHAKARLHASYGADAIVALRSPHAHVSPRATLGPGAIVQRGVTIMPNATIGRCCKFNVNATVHHDCAVGDFSTVAPGAQLLGDVHVGRRVFVGAGAVVRPRCSIGDGAYIGAGAVVIRDVPAGATVVGVPANRQLR